MPLMSNAMRVAARGGGAGGQWGRASARRPHSCGACGPPRPELALPGGPGAVGRPSLQWSSSFPLGNAVDVERYAGGSAGPHCCGACGPPRPKLALPGGPRAVGRPSLQ